VYVRPVQYIINCENLALLQWQTMILQISEDELISIGLSYGGFASWRNVVAKATIMNRFRAMYGCSPSAVSEIFRNIQAEEIDDEVRIKNPQLTKLLLTLRFLKTYDTEVILSGTFKMHHQTVRKWIWLYIAAISALKSLKVRKQHAGKMEMLFFDHFLVLLHSRQIVLSHMFILFLLQPHKM
jgi:hypothetical protein